mmetsp:Transcript_40288/g.92091  ORF Transcript_40288/g.92091 Transcript_40288/m.92091 type:complete len:220 (-) Transcript_40288:4-663(-)
MRLCHLSCKQIAGRAALPSCTRSGVRTLDWSYHTQPWPLAIQSPLHAGPRAANRWNPAAGCAGLPPTRNPAGQRTGSAPPHQALAGPPATVPTPARRAAHCPPTASARCSALCSGRRQPSNFLGLGERWPRYYQSRSWTAAAHQTSPREGGQAPPPPLPHPQSPPRWEAFQWPPAFWPGGAQWTPRPTSSEPRIASAPSIALVAKHHPWRNGNKAVAGM